MPGVWAPRAGTPADAVDGVVPRHVAEPDTPEALAETLAFASRERLQTVIRGGGTKIDWGRPPASVDLLVSTARLNRVIAHRHGDMTVTVQAGARLDDLNDVLQRERQWLPVVSPFDASTMGGLVATNESGPIRHREGTPRDLVIGITLALTDGRLVKAGGTVVKNVAGYDLGKLMSGSHGSLAAIADLTFKLVPVPHASATLVASYDSEAALAADAARLTSSQLEPAALDISAAGRERSLLALFASSPGATEAQVAGARALLSGTPRLVTGSDEVAIWRDHIRAPWRDGGLVVRLSWLPARLPHVVALIAGLDSSAGVRTALSGRVMGAGVVRIEGETAAQIAAVKALRASADVDHVVILRASHDVKRAVDVWGGPRATDAMARALKNAFDPSGILNAARGPI